MGALSDYQKQTLKGSGFLNAEINDLDSAKTPSGEIQTVAFNSVPFQRMIKSRRDWVIMCKKSGFTNDQIRRLLHNYYAAKKESNIWEFLKIEYQPTTRSLTDAEINRKLEIRDRLSKKLSKISHINYGESLPKEFSVVNRPKGYTPKPLMPVRKPITKPQVNKPRPTRKLFP